MRLLLEQGVGSQVHYMPVSDQPYYRDLYGRQNMPSANSYYEQVLSLPIFPGMTEVDVKKVVEVLGIAINQT